MLSPPTIIIFIFLIYGYQCINTWNKSIGSNGEDIWYSTSLFIPVQSQSFGAIRIGHEMSAEFDFVFKNRTNNPRFGRIENFFRVGYNALIADNCYGERCSYPSLWLSSGPNATATLQIAVSSSVGFCGLPRELSGYGALNQNITHHIKISITDTSYTIDITGGNKADYIETFDRTLITDQIGTEAPIWWMSNVNSGAGTADYNVGGGVFDNITIISNYFPTTEPTSDPTANPTQPTRDPTIEPTINPSNNPTNEPTAPPTLDPTYDPTIEPTTYPTLDPTEDPTTNPTFVPTEAITADPTLNTITSITSITSQMTSMTATLEQTFNPTCDPTITPTITPTINPSIIKTTDEAITDEITTVSVGSSTKSERIPTVFVIISVAFGCLFCCLVVVLIVTIKKKQSKRKDKEKESTPTVETDGTDNKSGDKMEGNDDGKERGQDYDDGREWNQYDDEYYNDSRTHTGVLNKSMMESERKNRKLRQIKDKKEEESTSEEGSEEESEEESDGYNQTPTNDALELAALNKNNEEESTTESDIPDTNPNLDDQATTNSAALEPGYSWIALSLLQISPKQWDVYLNNFKENGFDEDRLYEVTVDDLKMMIPDKTERTDFQRLLNVWKLQQDYPD